MQQMYKGNRIFKSDFLTLMCPCINCVCCHLHVNSPLKKATTNNLVTKI